MLLRLNADKIIRKKILNSDFSAVMHEINKTQPLALNLSSIYRINHEMIYRINHEMIYQINHEMIYRINHEMNNKLIVIS